MNNCVYDKVIIIGYGQIVNDCIKTLNEYRNKYGFEYIYIEYENTSISNSISLCEKEGINYLQIGDKQKLTEYFLEECEKTLIVSAGNFYIFPGNVVEKDNITIINFHSALLPKYPGRNAQTWAIFNGEKEAGATWHFVTKELDAGKYIIQKACRITENTKAYELTGEIMKVAHEAFVEIIENVLLDKYEKIQDLYIDPNRKIYKGKDIPGDGRFNLTDSVDYIYLLLRATDYGKSDIFPPMKTVINDKEVIISSYRLVDKDKEINKNENILSQSEKITDIIVDEKSVFIPYNDEKILRLRYKNTDF